MTAPKVGVPYERGKSGSTSSRLFQLWGIQVCAWCGLGLMLLQQFFNEEEPGNCKEGQDENKQ